jgi:hypothetical protein
LFLGITKTAPGLHRVSFSILRKGKMNTLTFPEFSGTRCLMMPYIQGDPDSIPDSYAAYREIVASTYLDRGAVGFLTIDESRAVQGSPHRGAHSKFGRALHTEVGVRPFSGAYVWGGGGWGRSARVTLDPDVEILLANNLDGSCAVWDAVHPDTSVDGDIGDKAHLYPLSEATLMRAADVHRIGILTPHESLPVDEDIDRQFLRIVGSGVHGREPYFTVNPLISR